jgi:hypothetical protein
MPTRTRCYDFDAKIAFFEGGGGVDVTSWGSAFGTRLCAVPFERRPFLTSDKGRPYHGRPTQKMLGSRDSDHKMLNVEQIASQDC